MPQKMYASFVHTSFLVGGSRDNIGIYCPARRLQGPADAPWKGYCPFDVSCLCLFPGLSTDGAYSTIVTENLLFLILNCSTETWFKHFYILIL